MNSERRAPRPWDTVEYQRIVAATYVGGQVVVSFADGAEARLAPQHLVPNVHREPFWQSVRADDFHLVVPSPDGEIEIPWDVIRAHSDPDFDAFWGELVDTPVVSGSARPARRSA
jgi:hypothetical protein